MKTRTITQTVTLPARPPAVFAALMKEKKHGAFTGDVARIDARAGGLFTCYGRYVSGVTLELVPGKLIIQAWRSRDWPKAHYSIVTFALSPSRGGKTKLRFTQIGVPAGDFKAKSAGWRSHYWEPLKNFLGGAK